MADFFEELQRTLAAVSNYNGTDIELRLAEEDLTLRGRVDKDGRIIPAYQVNIEGTLRLPKPLEYISIELTVE